MLAGVVLCAETQPRAVNASIVAAWCSKSTCSVAWSMPKRSSSIVARQEGFEVLEATTAAEALAQVARQPPEAMIVDLVLPDRDGIAITKELRTWSRMPIIVLSVIGEEEQKVRALAAGADDYVTKPFGPRELVARLRALLRRADAERSRPVIEAGGLRIELAGHAVATASSRKRP